MNGQGQTNFFGFSTSTTIADNTDVTDYVSFFSASAGTGSIPSVISQTIPQSTGGNDSEGNSITQYNFTTIEVASGTITGDAYYSFLIPDESIGGTGSGNRQTVIDVSNGQGPNTFVTSANSPSVYAGTVVNPGGPFVNGTYRLYTTNTIGSGLYFNNSSNTLYFKGNTVA